MAEVAKILGQSLIAATATVVYTTPVSTTTRVSTILAHNNDSSDRILTVHYVKSSGSVGTVNKVYNVTLKAGETIKLVDEGFFGAGDTIQALADAGSVISMTVTGIEIS